MTRSVLKLLALLAFVAAAVWVAAFTPVGESLAPARLRGAIEEMDPVIARAAYIGAYIVGTMLWLPGLLLSFVGAVLFGVWEGTLYTWIAATVGATLAFWLARALGRDFVGRMLRGKLESLDDRLRDHGFVGLLVLRLIPVFPFNGINFASGLTGIRVNDYVLATAIGILPGTFVYQFLFARLGEKMLAEGFSWRELLDPVLGLAILVFIAFAAVGRYIGRRFSAS